MKTSSLNEDIEKFQEILAKSAELEKDIPPRSIFDCQKRARVAKRKLTRLKNVSIPRPQYGGPKMMEEKAKQTVDDKKRSGNEIKRRMGARTRSRSHMEKKTGSPSSLKGIATAKKLPSPLLSTAPLSEKAVTFQEKVVTQNLYSTLMEKIRDASDDIDFGMLWRLLPKNIEVERSRFKVENEEGDKLLWKMQTAAFSDDIDLFFRQISGRLLDTAQSLPLV